MKRIAIRAAASVAIVGAGAACGSSADEEVKVDAEDVALHTDDCSLNYCAPDWSCIACDSCYMCAGQGCQVSTECWWDESCCSGRPLVIEGAARVAEVEERADWVA
jgi:hypothetical protein